MVYPEIINIWFSPTLAIIKKILVSYILNIIGIVSLIVALIPLGYGLYSLKINGFDKSIRFINIMLGVIGLSISLLSFYLSTNNEFLSIFHL